MWSTTGIRSISLNNQHIDKRVPKCNQAQLLGRRDGCNLSSLKYKSLINYSRYSETITRATKPKQVMKENLGLLSQTGGYIFMKITHTPER